MAMNFDPNGKKPQMVEWATYIPSRRPYFKTHKGRGQALNAFQYRDNAILYKLNKETDEWDEVYRLEGKVKRDTCDRCGETTLEDHSYKPVQTNRGTFMWNRVKPGGKTADPPHQVFVCRDCERDLRLGEGYLERQRISSGKRAQQRRIDNAIE